VIDSATLCQVSDAVSRSVSRSASALICARIRLWPSCTHMPPTTVYSGFHHIH
jgi:hypothetical protein